MKQYAILYQPVEKLIKKLITVRVKHMNKLSSPLWGMFKM